MESRKKEETHRKPSRPKEKEKLQRRAHSTTREEDGRNLRRTFPEVGSHPQLTHDDQWKKTRTKTRTEGPGETAMAEDA